VLLDGVRQIGEVAKLSPGLVGIRFNQIDLDDLSDCLVRARKLLNVVEVMTGFDVVWQS